MSQPALGLVASAVVMAIALGFIALFEGATFGTWTAFIMLGLIPMQVVAVVSWNGNPPFAARFAQPMKGLVLILVTAVAAVIAAPTILATIGEGMTPPGPVPTHYAIIVVVTTFWLTIMMGGWPFMNPNKSQVVTGLLLLVASYLITVLVFRLFFDYTGFPGAPASAPRGMLQAVSVLVFYVTALAMMFLVLCFDLWPLTTMPGVMKQPVLGLVWTLVALTGAGIAFYLGVMMMGTDPMIFLTRVTVPFIFGSIIVLNMLQNSLFQRMAQPAKGLMNTIAAAAIGVLLANLYGGLAPAVTGTLASGAPGYEYEIWLANALLSVTFPFLVFHAACFDYWPLPKSGATAGAPVRT